MIRNLSLAIIFLLPWSVNSQPVGDAISFEAILEELLTSDKSTIIVSDKLVDLGNYTARKVDRLFPGVVIDSGKVVLNKSLEFENCQFTGRGFRDLRINQLVLKNSNISSIVFMGVDIDHLEINGGQISHLKILNSRFDQLKIRSITRDQNEQGEISVFKSGIKHLIISECKDYNSIGVFASDLGNVRFANNASRLTGLASNIISGEVSFLDELADEYTIRKNTFLTTDSGRHVFDLQCERLTFIDNEIEDPVLFTESKISTRVEMADNEFRDVVDLHVVSLPEFDKYIPYVQFNDDLVVYKNVYGEDSPDGANCFYCELYTGGNDEELADKTNFDKLVHSYEILFLGYKATGDIESANAAYIKIKDLYLQRLGYLYRVNGGFKHYFRWKLAQLLKVYTNHGTDPALSIVISIYVVLAFAVFYFFFPSEWDVTSKARLIADFREFIDKNEKGRLKPFISLLAGFGISIVNAVTLSLNTFVTLGFGSIPTTGAARYVCIIQGFIGWFLLSIFTVSLINQILF